MPRQTDRRECFSTTFSLSVVCALAGASNNTNASKIVMLEKKESLSKEHAASNQCVVGVGIGRFYKIYVAERVHVGLHIGCIVIILK